MEKYTTTIRISYHIRDKLKEQADKLGMDMSSYIAFLVMYKEQKDKEQETARELLRTILEVSRSGLDQPKSVWSKQLACEAEDASDILRGCSTSDR